MRATGASLLVVLAGFFFTIPAGAFVELRGIEKVAAGEFHTCALTTAGGVKCWGSNDLGQLGDGSTTQRLEAVDVSRLVNVVAVVSGGAHTCALRADGGVKCWGRNDYGQLGDSSTVNRTSAVPVTGLSSGVVAIDAGRFHTCALMAGGGVKCWGFNGYGQLGDRSSTSRTTPVDVSGLASGVSSIAAGAYHTCAVMTTGAAKCWGSNRNGQVGSGSTSDFLVGSGVDPNAPVDVSGLASGVAAISAGGFHTCALTSVGGVRCWGSNSAGQVGDNSGVSRLTPVAVTGLASGVTAISAGSLHTCALTTSGAVRCWGSNTEGEIGDGTSADFRRAPSAVVGLASGVAHLSAGSYHTCAVKAGNGVVCWGLNFFGQLGDGASVKRLRPADVRGLEGGILTMALGDGHSCALTSAGGVKCWGRNSSGELGDGTQIRRLTPVDVPALTGGVARIAAGAAHTCALTSAGAVKCWGLNNNGQLGVSFAAIGTIVDVPGLSSGVAEIAASRRNTCAVTTAGALKCWGSNGWGQLGGDSGSDRAVPADVPGLESGVASVAIGGEHICALTTAGGVKCWGGNGVGQLGDGSHTARRTPVNVVGLEGGVLAIRAGFTHTCALTAARGIKCWGFNGFGTLGNGTETDSNVPVDVRTGGAPMVTLSVGGEHACAMIINGGGMCWGSNSVGELGDGSTTHRFAPVNVEVPTGFAGIWTGTYHTCARAGSGAVKCWGDNTFGQVGDGTSFALNSPVPVVTSTTSVAPTTNFTDLWWNPLQPARGINLAHQGNTLFATIYTYAPNDPNRPIWYFMSNGELQSDGSFLGTLYKGSGTPFNSQSWMSSIFSSVGTMRITFTSESSASVVYSVDGLVTTQDVIRFEFALPPTRCSATEADPGAATNYQDLWWNPAEPGWGVNLAHQGDVIFATLYVYGTDAAPMWLSMSAGRKVSDRTYSGELHRTSGQYTYAPSGLVGSYPVDLVGAMTLSFTDGAQGTLTYSVNGVQVTKPIQRFDFARPRPLCGPVVG